MKAAKELTAKRLTARATVAVTAALMAGTVLAQGSSQAPALSPEALARCAAQVQTLRADSAALTQKNAEYDLRRNAINERSATIKAERDALKPDDFDGGTALREQIKQHTAQTLAFNADVEQLKRDIEAVNVVKRDYDSNCANRPYRPADLEALPEADRAAMRAGLGGVQVPYIAP